METEVIKKLRWIGSSRKDLKNLPSTAQDKIGYNLYQAQLGKLPYYAKPLKVSMGFLKLFVISIKKHIEQYMQPN